LIIVLERSKLSITSSFFPRNGLPRSLSVLLRFLAMERVLSSSLLSSEWRGPFFFLHLTLVYSPPDPVSSKLLPFSFASPPIFFCRSFGAVPSSHPDATPKNHSFFSYSGPPTSFSLCVLVLVRISPPVFGSVVVCVTFFGLPPHIFLLTPFLIFRADPAIFGPFGAPRTDALPRLSFLFPGRGNSCTGARA